MTIEPIRHFAHTNVTPTKAFEIFTSKIARWWPSGNGVGAQPLVEVVIEPGVGGRWFERDAAGTETQWGHVLVWNPPGQLVLAWQLNRQRRFDPDLITEVEIRFTAAQGGGTDVALEHRDLERFGREGAEWLALIGGGWAQKLGEFTSFADLLDDEA